MFLINNFVEIPSLFITNRIVYLRGDYQAENEELKKSILMYAEMVTECIGGTELIIYFFGAVWMIAISNGGLLAMSDR